MHFDSLRILALLQLNLHDGWLLKIDRSFILLPIDECKNLINRIHCVSFCCKWLRLLGTAHRHGLVDWVLHHRVLEQWLWTLLPDLLLRHPFIALMTSLHHAWLGYNWAILQSVHLRNIMMAHWLLSVTKASCIEIWGSSCHLNHSLGHNWSMDRLPILKKRGCTQVRLRRRRGRICHSCCLTIKHLHHVSMLPCWEDGLV